MISPLLFANYLMYGLAFFAIGVAILFRDLSQSRLAIAKALPMLAMFGLLHGLHEWSELYLMLFGDSLALGVDVATLTTTKLWLSFLFLLGFGWRMIPLTGWRHQQWLKRLIGLALMLFTFDLIVRGMNVDWAKFIADTSSQVRWLFGLGGALLSGLAVIAYSHQLNTHEPQVATLFQWLGCGLIAYGLSTSVLTPEMGIWVLLVRILLACVVLVTLWRALSVFEAERQRRIEVALTHSLQDDKLREMGQLAAAIAHQVRTPLSSALISTYLVERQLNGSEAGTRALNQIRSSIERADHISQGILNYAQLRRPQRQMLELTALIRSTLEVMTHRLVGIELTLQLPEPLLLEADELLLQQVLSNLIENAIEAMAAVGEPKLGIRLEDIGSRVRLTVTDNGTGMEAEKLCRATEPFFTTKAQGTGLGLALSHQIIKQHHGHLSLANMDGGFQVELILPKETS